MPAAEDLIALFEAASLPVAVRYGTNLFRGAKARIPDGDGPYVSFAETGGTDEGTHNSNDAPAYLKPKFQIVVRAKNAEDAKPLADALYFLLWAVQNTFINGTWWRQTFMRGLPNEIAVDEKGRARFVFNFDAVKRVSPATS